MKKILVTILFVAALFCLNLAFAADKKQAMNPRKVPANKTYVVLDGKGKEIKRFKAGQTTSLGTDCVMIPCPGSFEPDVTCWKCKESLKAE